MVAFVPNEVAGVVELGRVGTLSAKAIHRTAQEKALAGQLNAVAEQVKIIAVQRTRVNEA